MGALNFIKSVFKNGFSQPYNQAKSIIGKIYSPIHKAVDIVGKVANKADEVVKGLREGNIPVVSQLARVVSDHPYYRGAMSAVQTAKDVDRTAQEIGRGIDQVVAPVAQGLDKMIGKG